MHLTSPSNVRFEEMRLPQDRTLQNRLSNATATAPEAGEDVTLPLSSGPIAVSLAEQELLGSWTLTVVTPNRRCPARSGPPHLIVLLTAAATARYRALRLTRSTAGTGYGRREASPAATNL